MQGALRRFDRTVSSQLLRVELRRLGLRTERLAEADELVVGVALVPVSHEVLAQAETLAPPTVATLDAIHLATALQLAAGTGLDALMTYDKRLAEGARHHGIEVLTPA